MPKTTFSKLLSERVIIGDGAMGTMLYQQGVFLNSCFDELNFTNPILVKKVHTDYIKAGADFIETNTFGANQFKLAQYGLAEKTEQINRAAVELAKQASDDQVLVAGAMGPLGCEITKYNLTQKKQAESAFQLQAKALAQAGADFLILETFSNTDELLIAIHSISRLIDLPIVAQMTINEENETIYGQKVEAAIAKIAAEEAVTAVGLNCSVGPASMLNTLELIRSVTDKPISVQPNAGLPRQVENRTLYMCTPEYMAEYAKRFFEKGARIIGGCCGTTPEHIKEIARVVSSLNKSQTPKKTANITITAKTSAPAIEQPCLTLAEKSKLGKKLATGRKITMIEITPPRGINITATLEKASLCAELGIDAINIPDGPRASSRLSPIVTACKIQQHADIETVFHFCCRDRNLIGMQSDILGAFTLDLHNALIITGDPPKLGEYPNATGVFDLDSVALVSVVQNLNHGLDIAGNSFSPPIALTVGVGANPVASDMEREISRFELKVKSGAEYAVTQPVFDEKMLFDFLESIESCKVPIVAGIWPFTSFKNAEFMANEVPGVVVPDKLLARMNKAKTKEQGRDIGIEIAQEMVEKIQNHVAGFAVSAPFGNVKIALSVLGKI